MNRRAFIVGTGGIGTAAIGGAVVLSGSAAAEIEDHTFTGTSISGESDDGSVEDVRAGATGVGFRYEGLNEEPEEATVELQVVHDGDVETIDEATTDVSGTSDTSVPLGEDLEGSVLDHDGLSADDFRAEEDGGITEKDVTLRLEVTITDVSGSSETDLNVVVRNTEARANVGGEAEGEVVTDEDEDDDDDEPGPVDEINAIVDDVNAELENVDPVETIDDTDDDTIEGLIGDVFGQVTAEIEAQTGMEYDVSTPEEARDEAEAADLPPVADALENAADAVEEIADIAGFDLDDLEDDDDDDDEPGPVEEINAIVEEVNAELENVDPVETIDDIDDDTIEGVIGDVFSQVTAEIEAQAGLEYDVSTPEEARDEAEDAPLPDIADALENAADAVEEIADLADYDLDEGDDDDDEDDQEAIDEINAIVEEVNAELENVDPVETIDDLDDGTIDDLTADVFSQVTAEIEAQAGIEYDVSTPEEARDEAEGAPLPDIADALENAADAVEEIEALADA